MPLETRNFSAIAKCPSPAAPDLKTVALDRQRCRFNANKLEKWRRRRKTGRGTGAARCGSAQFPRTSRFKKAAILISHTSLTRT